ncbi:MAG: hypothetical protein IJO20_06035 [Ruminococcus sp.]|nr:hypothetical protein [Ruminococcus sp.]
MKDNYKNAIRSITAPDSLIESTIESMQNTKTEVCVVGKSKHIAIKFTSAVAAVLALIIGLSVIPFGGNKPDSEHNFVITAGAAEITPQMYVEVGEIENYCDFGHFKLHAYLDENKNLVVEDNDEELLDLMKEFTIEMICAGDNIESITYSANNSCLSYNPDYEGLLDATALTEEEIEKYGATGSSNNFLWASACTFDYNCQPQSRSIFNEEEAEFEIPEEWVDGSIPLRMAFSFSFKEGEYVLSPDKDGNVDTDPVFMNEFNAHANEFSLDVTANFKDGKKTTKTLQFKCESVDGRLLMYAIEI